MSGWVPTRGDSGVSLAREDIAARERTSAQDFGEASANAVQPQPDSRVISVDTLRGLTILLMVFVNDLGRGAPSWMHHIRPPRADGMTLADIVFPFFLFIVGISIPLALERAEFRGTTRWKQLGHVLIRSAGLLLLGVIELNSDEDRALGSNVWGTLAFICVILAWCVIPRASGWKRGVLIALKTLGVLGLLVLLAIYRREPGTAEVPLLGTVSNWAWLRTGWWGILGLIGWAYLTVSLLVLLVGKRLEWLMGCLAILIVLHVAMRSGGLFARLDHKPWLGAMLPVLKSVGRGVDAIGEYIGLGDAVGSLAAITMAGCLLGTILRRDSDIPDHRGRVRWALTFVVGLFVAGLTTDTFEGINKIAATPTWCLWCAALACALWILLYQVIDVAGYRAWSIVVRPAGSNPLIAYFLHPIVTGLVSLSGLWDSLLAYKSSHEPWLVVAGSLCMALFICACTGMIARLGLRVHI
jgi:heparan-alpha-glucosaminide N-acetyltransferase